MKKGLFITFEGPEGSGKSTQIKRLGALLERTNMPFVLTREPGGTKNPLLRNYLLEQYEDKFAYEAELFLFLADRTQHVKELLEPALNENKIVICDRYTDSTLAYQGGGRGFSIDLLRILNKAATGGLKPDITILFDVPVEIGLKRAETSKNRKDRMEREPISFHRRVRKAYLSIAKKEKKRFLVLDCRKSEEDVYQAMLEGLIDRLPLRKKGVRNG